MMNKEKSYKYTGLCIILFIAYLILTVELDTKMTYADWLYNFSRPYNINPLLIVYLVNLIIVFTLLMLVKKVEVIVVKKVLQVILYFLALIFLLYSMLIVLLIIVGFQENYY